MAAESSRQRIRVGHADEVPTGTCLRVEVAGRALGIFQIDGQFRAVLNHCPHEGAPICDGSVRGTTLPSVPGTFQWGRENEILACPWHGWEFSLASGQCLTDRRRLAIFPTEVADDGSIFVLMRGHQPQVSGQEQAERAFDTGAAQHQISDSAGQTAC